MSTHPALYPLLIEPALHVRVWGGRRLAETLHKNLPTNDPYGESWELHDSTRVANGPLAGVTVGELVKRYGAELIGPDNDPADGFPLLVKWLDATDWLSVQVHPNDAQAQALEGYPRGKTEAWYVLDADPGAQLVIGVHPGSTRESVAAAVNAGQMERVLEYREVKPGDVLSIAAGTIHALGPGLLIYEIQQSSDITYRFYDWGRVGLDGQPRALHIDKSLEVSTFDRLPELRSTAGETGSVIEIVRTPFFHTMRYDLRQGAQPLNTEGQWFNLLSVIDGEAVVTAGEWQVTIPHGATLLIPASLGTYTLSGDAHVLASSQQGTSAR